MKNLIRAMQSSLLDCVTSRWAIHSLEKRAELFVSLFENEIPKRSAILDIGGRWGFYAGPLEKRGHQPVVLDIVLPRFQQAPVVIYDGRQMPFPDKSFDASLFVTVLHHIPDQAAVIREACRVTRKRVIVIEDLFHHTLGRYWTEIRDRLYNFEWVGHPCGFRKAEEWRAFFGLFGLTTSRFVKVDTELCGLSILNGIFILDL